MDVDTDWDVIELCGGDEMHPTTSILSNNMVLRLDKNCHIFLLYLNLFINVRPPAS